MTERPHIFGIPKPFPILTSGETVTPKQQQAASERFAAGTETPIFTRQELAAKRDKAFGIQNS